LASQARLQYRVFIQQRSLDHAHYDHMDDEFDTPAAVYLVCRDQAQVVRGLMRCVPTSVPYMLERYWPELCQSRSLPKSDKVWESSRVCYDRAYDPNVRKRIMPEPPVRNSGVLSIQRCRGSGRRHAQALDRTLPARWRPVARRRTRNRRRAGGCILGSDSAYATATALRQVPHSNSCVVV
jgi:hypothetical protein